MLDIFYFDKTVKKGKVNELAILKNKKIWIDATNITKEEADLLRKTFKLHPVTEEDMFLSHGRIKTEEFPNYLFNTFYSIEKINHKIKLIPLEYIVGKNFIISLHKEHLATYAKVKEEVDLLEDLFRRGVDTIFHRLLDEELDNFYPVLSELDNQIEKIDEQIAQKHNPELMGKILDVKKKLVEIKKVAFPQRERLAALARKRHGFISDKTYPYLRDLHDHSTRVLDIVESYREAASNTFDAYLTTLTNRSNDVMKVLSIIATITLPLSVVSSVYGTNFIKLPGANTPEGFWIMILVMGVMMVGMLIFFKDRKWI